MKHCCWLTCMISNSWNICGHVCRTEARPNQTGRLFAGCGCWPSPDGTDFDQKNPSLPTVTGWAGSRLLTCPAASCTQRATLPLLGAPCLSGVVSFLSRGSLQMSQEWMQARSLGKGRETASRNHKSRHRASLNNTAPEVLHFHTRGEPDTTAMCGHALPVRLWNCCWLLHWL